MTHTMDCSLTAQMLPDLVPVCHGSVLVIGADLVHPFINRQLLQCAEGAQWYEVGHKGTEGVRRGRGSGSEGALRT